MHYPEITCPCFSHTTHRQTSGHPHSCGSSGRRNAARAILDCQELDSQVEFYLDHALAPSTKRTYGSAKKRYILFCHSHNIPPFPTSEPVQCRYVAHLANSSLKHTSIKCYLAAVRHLQIELGQGDPDMTSMAKLELVTKGVKRVQVAGQSQLTCVGCSTLACQAHQGRETKS